MSQFAAQPAASVMPEEVLYSITLNAPNFRGR